MLSPDDARLLERLHGDLPLPATSELPVGPRSWTGRSRTTSRASRRAA